MKRTTCFSTKTVLLIVLAIFGFAFIFKDDLNRITDRDTQCK